MVHKYEQDILLLLSIQNYAKHQTQTHTPSHTQQSERRFYTTLSIVVVDNRIHRFDLLQQ